MKSFLPIFLLFLVSCGDDDQKVYSKLEGLRVLAIQADTPEITSAGTVTMTPYLSYPESASSTLSIDYVACPDPGITFGAKVSCDSAPLALKVQGSTTFAMSTIGSTNFFTGPGPGLAIAVPPAALAALTQLSPTASFNGIDYLVIIKITDPANPNQTITSLKRILLSTKSSGLNTNPSIGGGILANGSSLTAFPKETVKLQLGSPSDPQDYIFQSTEGPRTLQESMTASWFSNAGEVQFSRTDAKGLTEFRPMGSTAGVFVAVYRDSRGGVVIERKAF